MNYAAWNQSVNVPVSCNVFGITVSILHRRIEPSQGLYLLKATQKKKDLHLCHVLGSNTRYQFSRGPQIVHSCDSAENKVNYTNHSLRITIELMYHVTR
jgi:hypothetical protein